MYKAVHGGLCLALPSQHVHLWVISVHGRQGPDMHAEVLECLYSASVMDYRRL